jgi:hypothetical protein
MLEAIREQTAEYIERDAALWRTHGYPYAPGEVEGILDRLRQPTLDARLLRLLKKWFDNG